MERNRNAPMHRKSGAGSVTLCGLPPVVHNDVLLALDRAGQRRQLSFQVKPPIPRRPDIPFCLLWPPSVSDIISAR